MKEIRLFEAFAGVGSQYSALKKIGVDVEPVGISEWNIPSILAYDSIHSDDTDIDLTEGLTVTEVEDELIKRGISNNGKSPLSEEKIRNLKEEKKRKVLSAMIRTNNIGSIVGNVAPECDLFTYSFPCQDISVAGRQNGFDEESNTRSSLLWECRRTIEEVKPQVLLMENVRNLVSYRHIDGFRKWIKWLEGQGYTNYWQVLNSCEYGIPQKRERVFMVSILGEHNEYKFPENNIPMKSLQEVLLDKVEEKWYINDETSNELLFGEKEISEDKRTIDNLLPHIRPYVEEGKQYIGGSRGRPIDNPTSRVVGVPTKQRFEINKHGRSNTLTTVKKDNYALTKELRVRNLTPLEYWRLMGFSDEEYSRAKKVTSDIHLYNQMGNSIVVNVLEEIFRSLYLSDVFVQN